MNPRVRPAMKNVASLSGKNGVRRDLDKGITSLVKDGGKATSVNFDLSNLDIVSLSLPEGDLPKSGHVQFLTDNISNSRKASRTQIRSCSCEDTTYTKRGTTKKISCSEEIHSEVSEGRNSSVDNEEKTEDASPEDEVTCMKIAHKKCWSAGRSYSFDSQNSRSTAAVQRSHSLCKETTSPKHRLDSSPRFRERNSIHRVNQKDSQSLLAAYRESTITTSATSTAPTPCIVNNKPSSSSRKNSGTGLSVHFADSVIVSSKPKIKYASSKNVHTKSSVSKTSSRYNIDHKTDHAHKEQTKTYLQETDCNLCLSKKTKRCEEKCLTTPTRDATHSMTTKRDGDECCDITKNLRTGTPNETGDCSDERFLNQHTYFNKSPNGDKFEYSNLTNHGSSKGVNSAYLKRPDQSKRTFPQGWVSDDLDLLLTSPLLLSSSSSSEEPWPTIASDLSSSASSTPLSQMSPPKRSSSSLKNERRVTEDLDYTSTSDLAQKDGSSGHSPSAPLLGKRSDAALSDMKPSSAFTLTKRPEFDAPPFSHRSVASASKKQTIAASYQLEHCWFCGRPMLPFDLSLRGREELQNKVAELEVLLARAQSEKVKLVEEQAKIRESEKLVLKKNEALKKELEQIKLREDKRTLTDASPLARALPNGTKELDLRVLVEASGHQLDVCPHVTVTSHSCRGFLYKMGGRFRTWKKRWFVFDAVKSVIFYFSDKTEVKLKGSVCFQAIEEVYTNHFRTTKSPNPKLTFCLKTYNKTYYLVAPSSDAMAVWIDVLYSGAEGFKTFYEKMSA